MNVQSYRMEKAKKKKLSKKIVIPLPRERDIPDL
jgi:hypothetical protein